MGVDVMCIDLEEETKRGGPYFQPLSQQRVDSWDLRPEFRIAIDDEDSWGPWSFSDANVVHLALRGQLYYSEGLKQVWQDTRWEPRRYSLLKENTTALL